MMIAVRNLNMSFGSYHALQGIDLNVNQGEIYGFIGHNGAGKTTTMNILAGLSRPTSGECTVNGKNVRSIHHPSELDIGYLPEEPKFYPWMTAAETLDYLGNSTKHRVNKAKCREMLAWVGLEKAASRRVGGFSRGMKQRLGIAAAMVHDPALLFLDEPASALDPEGRSDVLNLIRDLKKEGKTIFFSTHILEDVERVCDRVGMLAQGRIVLEKPLDVLLNEHITPIYDVDIPHLDPQFKKELETVEGVTHVSIDHDHAAVTIANADACAPRLLAFFAEKGLPVRSFALRKSSLEDIFIREANEK